MKRNVNINEISDGKLYGLNDMVKAGCDGCRDCSACCQGMGKTVVLDPIDIYRLTSNLACTFEQLLSDKVELNVVDGIVLPNLKMDGSSEKCRFLNEEGRCSIHSFRPGICRLFPLGRIYEDGSFKYFLQVNECSKKNKTKVKVKNWIDTPDIKEYEKFVTDWHYMLKSLESVLEVSDEAVARQISMYVLSEFYMEPYNDSLPIYAQLDEKIKKALHTICFVGQKS
ncbi:MAG: YkgJ family cysteine cluster protein [Lachnospiraceae bacterium]|nr:YkgJ family cysteine cluster protein [Lachnospiraceae bacterium]